jgi:hypothetical protein
MRMFNREAAMLNIMTSNQNALEIANGGDRTGKTRQGER